MAEADAEADKEKKEEGKDEAGGDGQEKAPMSTKKLIIIMSAVFVLILVLVVVILVVVLKPSKPEPMPAEEAVAEAEAKPEPKQTALEAESLEQPDATPKADPEAESEAVMDMPQAEKKGRAVFYTIRPVFVVNFQTSKRAKFLQVNVDVMARDDDVIDDIVDYLPVIKNDLVALFSSQKYDDLRKPEGKERLRKAALKVVREILYRETGRRGVEDILFTSFVMQ